MAGFLKRFGFGTAVVAVVLGVGAMVAGKQLLRGQDGQAGAAQAAAGAAKKKAKGGGETPGVIAAVVEERPFYDVVQAIGTANANESIVVTAKVADVIRRIRFDSGDRVARGQVLVELANVEQEADLAEARANLVVQTREYERFRELGERGFAPTARVEQERAGYDQAKARVAALEARIADRTIRAPFAGVMGLRTASAGALVRPGDPIATLDDVSAIKLDFGVAEAQISQVRPGSEIVATSTALPDRSYNGRVADLDSRLDPQSRLLRVRAILPNRDGQLKPGMLMRVEVRSNPRRRLSAPEIAVVERSDGAYVYVIEEKDGKPTARPVLVEVGRRSGGLAEIVSGVEPGQRVIVEGVQRVRPGQPIRILPPKGQPDGSGAGAGGAAQ